MKALAEITELQHKIAQDFLETFEPKVSLTRNGSVAIIISDQAGEYSSLMGCYWSGDEWITCKWDSEGRYPSINESNYGKAGLDLILHQTNTEFPKGAA